jgi:signal peptidase I
MVMTMLLRSKRVLRLAAPPLAAASALAALAAWRLLRRVEVEGDSMRPTLLAGDRLLVLRRRRARPGHLVVLADPRQESRLLVKRVAAVEIGRASCRERV